LSDFSSLPEALRIPVFNYLNRDSGFARGAKKIAMQPIQSVAQGAGFVYGALEGAVDDLIGFGFNKAEQDAARIRGGQAEVDRVVAGRRFATPEQIARSQDAGANAYLTKPLNVPKFLHTVQTLLKEN